MNTEPIENIVTEFTEILKNNIAENNTSIGFAALQAMYTIYDKHQLINESSDKETNQMNKYTQFSLSKKGYRIAWEISEKENPKLDEDTKNAAKIFLEDFEKATSEAITSDVPNIYQIALDVGTPESRRIFLGKFTNIEVPEDVIVNSKKDPEIYYTPETYKVNSICRLFEERFINKSYQHPLQELKNDYAKLDSETRTKLFPNERILMYAYSDLGHAAMLQNSFWDYAGNARAEAGQNSKQSR